MVRRSASQQNLSQDMMAETLAQANHCFSISANTKIYHPSTPKTEGVILPEMVNAVICPETGKSLKHQELITKSKYKIQCMRSTANEIDRLYTMNTIQFIRRSEISKG
jgi:methyl coenzyme M reductase subunit C